MNSLRIISVNYYWYNDDNIPDIIIKGYISILKMEIIFSINCKAKILYSKVVYHILHVEKSSLFWLHYHIVFLCTAINIDLFGL